MSRSSTIKPNQKAIKHYYEALQAFSEHHATHEGAVETAFGRLLADTGRQHDWTLIPKQKLRVGKNYVIPDGTLRDMYTRRGFWEAKDTDDDLDAEISKKLAKGYPTVNTIFEDTRQAVLYQGGRERQRFDLSDKRQLADLLNEFYGYSEPEIDNFHQAVDEFQSRVPQLAQMLVKTLTDAHKSNRKFQAAFETFFTVCQQTLNPNISRAAVDEMLVQHLLTERLFRKMFDNPEFVRRNVIAAEIEKVIEALVSLSFNRDQFLKSLDKFYRAIEEAAHTLDDFGEKQHFLNTIYERFFQGYSVKVADTHGIVYTPQEIVDFMCASVDEVLKKEFGLSLGDSGVNILDPCTGTGNFIVNIMRRIPKKDLPRIYREQMFANEVMLLPYYIAAMNIEHAYWELKGEYESFEGLCFVDTLDLDEEKSPQFSFMTEANTARVQRQRQAPITVIIGNPPYNMGQVNENDNNKNRKYPVIDARIAATYARDSSATLRSALRDPYVKFFRWAVDRLGDRDGVVCFVSNNSFVDQLAFDGMRKHLLEDFSEIHHLDLSGNVRQNPKLSGTAYNVFGIQVGVGITVAVRKTQEGRCAVQYHRVPESWRREEKLQWLAAVQRIGTLEWRSLSIDDPHVWIGPEHAEEFSSFVPIGSRAAKYAKGKDECTLFRTYSPGISTCRDSVVYDFDSAVLRERVQQFCDDYNTEVDRYRRRGKGQDLDSFLDCSKVKWSRNLKNHVRRGSILDFDAKRIRRAMYRPFTAQFIYYDDVIDDSPGLFRQIFPAEMAESGNVLIWLKTGTEWPAFALTASRLVDWLPQGGSQCFPFYVYGEDGTSRRENISDWALSEFRKRYGDKKISKWDMFYYIYGVLHQPDYRTKFADNFKRELPRIPFAPDFKAFAIAGKALAGLHLDYEELEPWPLKWIEAPGVPLSYRVDEKMRLNKDKTTLVVNPSLTLAGIPPEVFEYKLGNRSALEWVIDQYQVSEDERSGIKSDPNRADDEEYIVRLVGQVVRVSVETVKIVKGLPRDYSDADGD
jgi:predicted helicase